MTQRVFKVVQIGLEGADLVAFERILEMSKKRDRAYQIVKFEAGQIWDILVVRAGDQLGKSLQFAAKADGGSAVITIGEVEDIVDIEFSCATPLMPARLLQTLDQVTVSVLHYTPEIVIDDDASVNDVSAMQVKHQRREKVRRRALVVDDSAPVRKQLEKSLDLLGIEVDLAADGDEAFINLQQQQYDIVFLDVVMPGISGFDICRSIKKNPSTRDVPVVMLTGKDSKIDKVKGAMAGCQGYLTKPLNHELFQQSVSELMRIG